MPPDQRQPEDRVIRLIAAEGKITDDDPLKQVFVRRGGMAVLAEQVQMNVVEMMAAVVSANRMERMKPFMAFISKTIEQADKRRGMWKKVKKMATTSATALEDVSIRVAASSDVRFTDWEDNFVDETMRAMIQDDETAHKWMKEVDKNVDEKSEALLAEIDSRAESGSPRVKIPRLVVGDGPLAASALVQLGPYNRMGIVTNRAKLGSLWRDRSIYINSSSREDNPLSPPLPLQNRGTTRTAPTSHLNALRPVHLLNADSGTLKVRRGLFQESGEIIQRTREYIPGQALGRIVAHNEVMNAEYFLMNQEVLFDQAKIAPDGKTKILTIKDVRTGRLREIETDYLDVVTGPGEETLTTVDEETRLLYEKGIEQVDALIYKVKILKSIGARIPPTMITQALPRVLTLTIMEKLHGMWEDVFDREDRYWPFRDLVRDGVVVGNAGGGDTTRVIAEFCNQKGPREGYPSDLDSEDIPIQYLYNAGADNKAGYDAKTRARYENVWGENTRSARSRRVESVRMNKDNKSVEVIGDVARLQCDYVFLSLGFKRKDMVAMFDQAGIPIAKIFDSQGEVMGLGNRGLGINLNGSATGFGKDDLPDNLRNVIEILGIGENTVALWVYNLLLTRNLWETGTVDKAKVLGLVQAGVKERGIDSLRSTIQKGLNPSGVLRPDRNEEGPVKRQIERMAQDLERSLAIQTQRDRDESRISGINAPRERETVESMFRSLLELFKQNNAIEDNLPELGRTLTDQALLLRNLRSLSLRNRE